MIITKKQLRKAIDDLDIMEVTKQSLFAAITTLHPKWKWETALLRYEMERKMVRRDMDRTLK